MHIHFRLNIHKKMRDKQQNWSQQVLEQERKFFVRIYYKKVIDIFDTADKLVVFFVTVIYISKFLSEKRI